MKYLNTSQIVQVDLSIIQNCKIESEQKINRKQYSPKKGGIQREKHPNPLKSSLLPDSYQIPLDPSDSVFLLSAMDSWNSRVALRSNGSNREKKEKRHS